MINPEELKNYLGKFICIYGGPGVGKTCSTLATGLDPMLWFTTEPRDFEKAVEAANRPDLRFHLAVYEDFMDLIEYLSDPENFKKYKTVFFDGLSYLHNIVMPSEIQEEEYDKDSPKKILAMTKITMPQQGERNQAIFRVLRLLAKNVVAQGKVAIVSCLEMERPKYDRELTAGPALGGKEVPDNFGGFFDLIGRVTANLNDEGEIVYPPWISFESSGGFAAKYTGRTGRKEGPLDWSKILGGLSGKKKTTKKDGK